MNANEPKEEGCRWKSMDCRMLVLVSLFLLLILSIMSPAQAQDYIKAKNRHYKAQFRKERYRFLHACDLLEKKKYSAPRHSHFKIKKHQISPPEPVDHSTIVASISPKTIATPEKEPAPKKPYPMNPKIEVVPEAKVDQMHEKEDEVLARNHLPVPTSQEHERVRKMIADKLASKTNVYPLHLDPLYFNFDQDEFSVVDMEPFLIAAEYAIQGRTVLIEGHTDNRGADNYNVQLSIKRVEKIRQLMHDIGVPDDRISVVGYGEELGNHNNSSSDARQKNRRVDFTIF